MGPRRLVNRVGERAQTTTAHPVVAEGDGQTAVDVSPGERAAGRRV
jgi:hypothetical protein